jgi:hypothetical protein
VTTTFIETDGGTRISVGRIASIPGSPHARTEAPGQVGSLGSTPRRCNQSEEHGEHENERMRYSNSTSPALAGVQLREQSMRSRAENETRTASLWVAIPVAAASDATEVSSDGMKLLCKFNSLSTPLVAGGRRLQRFNGPVRHAESSHQDPCSRAQLAIIAPKPIILFRTSARLWWRDRLITAGS